MEKAEKKKGLFPQDIKTNLILVIGGWFFTFVIDYLKLEGAIFAVIGGVGAIAFLGGLIGLILAIWRKLKSRN